MKKAFTIIMAIIILLTCLFLIVDNKENVTGFEQYIKEANGSELKVQLCVYNSNAVHNGKEPFVQKGIDINISTDKYKISMGDKLGRAEYKGFNTYIATMQDCIVNNPFQEEYTGNLEINTKAESLQMSGTYLFTGRPNIITIIFVPDVSNIDTSLYDELETEIN